MFLRYLLAQAFYGGVRSVPAPFLHHRHGQCSTPTPNQYTAFPFSLVLRNVFGCLQACGFSLRGVLWGSGFFAARVAFEISRCYIFMAKVAKQSAESRWQGIMFWRWCWQTECDKAQGERIFLQRTVGLVSNEMFDWSAKGTLCCSGYDC